MALFGLLAIVACHVSGCSGSSGPQTSAGGNTPYTEAIDQGRQWLELQIVAYQASGGATGGAQSLSQFLITNARDSREQHLRMGRSEGPGGISGCT